MTGHFKQYIPAFCIGVERTEFDFETLEELLEKQLKPVENFPNLKYYYEQYMENCQLLIQGFDMVVPISDTVNKTEFQWVVLGYVYNFDLSKHLPRIEYSEEYSEERIEESITIHNPGDEDNITIPNYTIKFHP